MQYYCAHRELNFNPLDFIDEGDECYFITGRSADVEQLTIDWAKKYFPTVKVFVTKCRDCTNKQSEMVDWFDIQAQLKANIINENSIDVYFEDSPEITRKLRELCPNCKVIKYSSRVVTENF